MSAAPRFADMQRRMDRANILALQLENYSMARAHHDIPRGYFINAVWVRRVTIQGSTGTLDTVMIPRPAARFPRELQQKEAFEAAMHTFAPIVNPLLPTWLPTKVLDVTPTVSHIIACAMPLPDLQFHPLHAKFLRKAIDIAYSIIESPRSRVVLHQFLQDMVVDWNETKKPHAYNHRRPKLSSEQTGVVAHFLKRLRQNFPVMKLRDDSHMNGNICIMKMVRDDCTDIAPMCKLIPREEMAIVFNLKVSNFRLKSTQNSANLSLIR